MAKEKEGEHNVNGEGYYSVTHFIKDMPCILDWDYPKYSHPLWVFWTRPHHQHQSPHIPPSCITEKIKYALLRHSHAALGGKSNTLVQFWAPSTIGGRLVLRTSNQPFSINRIDRGLCEYRKHCLVYEIDVEEKEEGCVIRRVFRREYPEINPDVEYYSTDEYPQRDFALKCGVRRCLALPVFEASGRGCVGVLEVVDTATQHSSFTSNLFGIAYSILQEGNFKSFSGFDFQMGEDLTDTVVVINEILEEVCTTHQLLLAQIWVPCSSHRGGYLEKRSNSFDLIHSDILSTTCHVVNHGKMFDFSRSCAYHPMRKGQGLVGKALLSRKACFCRDVTQLPITEFPLAHYARKCGLTGCFAICLRDNYIENQDYVLEFFLPPCETASGNSQNFLDSLLATMKKLFGGLKISSGKELGDELYVEVIKCSSNDEPDYFKICEATRPPLVPGALENEREGLQLNAVDEQLSVKTVSSAEQNIVVVACSGIESGVETSEMEYRTTEISLTREDLKQHFGKKLEDAAKILGVSRSTMKRVCRECGIKKWPFPKRKKFNPSLPPPHKHANEFVESRKERIPKRGRKEPSSSNLPPEQPTAAVPHTKTSAMPMQVVRTMTVKATYGDDIVKFQLPFSSKTTDLVEKVTMRFPVVTDTPLSIKYEDDDGDWVLIACDEDLQECMDSLRLLGNTAIKMLVQPMTNQVPRI